MDGARTIVLGSVLGIIGALPPAFLFELALREDRRANVAYGFVSILVSFIMLMLATMVVWMVSRSDVLVFGVAEAVSFLLVWVVEAWRAWRNAQRDVGPGERKQW